MNKRASSIMQAPGAAAVALCKLSLTRHTDKTNFGIYLETAQVVSGNERRKEWTRMLTCTLGNLLISWMTRAVQPLVI